MGCSHTELGANIQGCEPKTASVLIDNMTRDSDSDVENCRYLLEALVQKVPELRVARIGFLGINPDPALWWNATELGLT